MWYLYMITGLYLAVPFLRPVVADRTLLKQFMLLCFLLDSIPREVLTEEPYQKTVQQIAAPFLHRWVLNYNTDKEIIFMHGKQTVAAQPLGHVTDALGAEAVSGLVCNRKTVCKDGLFRNRVLD